MSFACCGLTAVVAAGALCATSAVEAAGADCVAEAAPPPEAVAAMGAGWVVAQAVSANINPQVISNLAMGIISSHYRILAHYLLKLKYYAVSILAPCGRFARAFTNILVVGLYFWTPLF